MATSKPRSRIDLPQAVKRMDKALKRETGTPPRPYRPRRDKKKRSAIRQQKRSCRNQTPARHFSPALRPTLGSNPRLLAG